ncbi:hypothetical protein BDV18DRAFT_148058 [Aspergillus unguis]
MPRAAVHRPEFKTYNGQSQSPLFRLLPAEVRNLIFTYALSPYEDTSNAYSKETYWTRPGYSAPHKTSTALLRACKRTYAETWFMPFALADHTFYLTAQDRAPQNPWFDKKAYSDFLKTIHAAYAGGVEIQNVQIFAQLYKLEPGEMISDLLDTPHLRPRYVRLTIRYTDFWHWENNRPLYIDGTWVGKVRFPDSVRAFVIDFESLERRKEEVDFVSQGAVEKWTFKRQDGRLLQADKEMSVSKWTGSSMLGGRRWVRDEERPGQLDYYVVTATWKLSSETESPEAEEGDLKVRVPDDYQQPEPPYTEYSSIPEEDMRAFGATMDMPAQTAVDAVYSRRHKCGTSRVRQYRRCTKPGRFRRA